MEDPNKAEVFDDFGLSDRLRKSREAAMSTGVDVFEFIKDSLNFVRERKNVIIGVGAAALSLGAVAGCAHEILHQD